MHLISCQHFADGWLEKKTCHWKGLEAECRLCFVAQVDVIGPVQKFDGVKSIYKKIIRFTKNKNQNKKPNQTKQPQPNPPPIKPKQTRNPQPPPPSPQQNRTTPKQPQQKLWWVIPEVADKSEWITTCEFYYLYGQIWLRGRA